MCFLPFLIPKLIFNSINRYNLSIGNFEIQGLALKAKNQHLCFNISKISL